MAFFKCPVHNDHLGTSGLTGLMNMTVEHAGPCSSLKKYSDIIMLHYTRI